MTYFLLFTFLISTPQNPGRMDSTNNSSDSEDSSDLPELIELQDTPSSTRVVTEQEIATFREVFPSIPDNDYGNGIIRNLIAACNFDVSSAITLYISFNALRTHRVTPLIKTCKIDSKGRLLLKTNSMKDVFLPYSGMIDRCRSPEWAHRFSECFEEILNITLKKLFKKTWKTLYHTQIAREMFVTENSHGGFSIGSSTELINSNLQSEFPDCNIVETHEEIEEILQTKCTKCEDDCIICQDSLYLEMKCCKTKIHPDCLINMLKESNTNCPNCRHPLRDIPSNS